MNTQAAFDLIGIKNVQGSVLVIGEEIGDIDQGGDGAQADGFELRLQPRGRWPVLYATDHAACEMRRAIKRIGVNRHGDRAGVTAFDGGDLIGFQRAKTARGQIPRHATHAKRILAVRGDGNFNHRVNLFWIMLCQPIGKALTHLARRQFDDAVMFV